MHDDIKNYNTHFIEGTVISNMLHFVYLCPCFKEEELIELCIGDIQYQDGQIIDVTIKDGNGNIVNEDITDRGGISAKNLIREHIEYLRSQEYRITGNSALFPGKNREQYNKRTLQRHFEKLREKFRDDDIKIDYERHESIINRYAELKQNKSKTITECLEGAAEFGWCDESNVKKILVWKEQREHAYSEYLMILSKLYLPSKVDNENEVDEEKLIKQKMNFFNTLDNDKYIGKIMKEKFKNVFIRKYKKRGIEFNPDNTVTITRTPTSVPTLEEYLRRNGISSEEVLRSYPEQILVRSLRYINKPENYIALKLGEYLVYLSRSEEYIQNRFRELGVEKLQPENLTQESSRHEYTQEERDKMLRKHTSLPDDPDAGRNNRFENRIIEKIQRGRIIFSDGFSLE